MINYQTLFYRALFFSFEMPVEEDLETRCYQLEEVTVIIIIYTVSFQSKERSRYQLLLLVLATPSSNQGSMKLAIAISNNTSE